MDRKNRNVFLIFFLFSSLLFLSFEGFHLYLVNRTGSFLEDFARQRVRKSFEEFQQTLLKHELFPSLFKKGARSELVWNHFYRELSRIERGFELKSLALVDSKGKISYAHTGYDDGDDKKLIEILKGLKPEDK